MIFKNERQLQIKLEKTSFDFFSNSPVSFIRREVRVGGCIPDLVSVHFEQDPSLFKWPSKWSTKHSFIVWLLRNTPLSFNEIASSFFEPVEKVKPLVDYIISSGLAYINTRNKISLTEQLIEKSDANVIAVEAKIKDWQQALIQAKRYKEFADIVFVAMDASFLPKSSRDILNFELNNIGLCAVSKTKVDWVFKPHHKNTQIGHEKEYLVMSAVIPTTQRLWARRNNRNASAHA